MKTYTIAVLMTVHNRKEKTIRCLNHLFSQDGIGKIFTIEVFLTDDGCTDHTRETISCQFPQVNIIDGDGSLFWNRGMYHAWVAASKKDFDYYLWINDDTFIFDRCITNLIELALLEDGASIIAGSTCDSATKSTTTYGGLDKKRNLLFCSEHSIQCNYFNGNIALISRKIYMSVGLNDYYYRHSLGDMDYSLMALNHGFNILLAKGYQGICDIHEYSPIWKNPAYSFKARWNDMMKPTGANPFELFYFRRKFYGFIPACFTFVTNIIHVCFPSIWKRTH